MIRSVSLFFYFGICLALMTSFSASPVRAQEVVRPNPRNNIKLFQPSTDAEKLDLMRSPGVLEIAKGYAYEVPDPGYINADYLVQVFAKAFDTCLGSSSDVSKFLVLTQAEALSICLYTNNFYQNVALQINEAIDRKQPMNAAILMLDRALAKLPNYTKAPVIHNQTMSAAGLKMFVPGRKIRIPQFMSSSKAEGYFAGNLKLIIKPRTGKDIRNLSSIPYEEEVLFPRDTVFIVRRAIRTVSPEDATSIIYKVWLEEVAK